MKPEIERILNNLPAKERQVFELRLNGRGKDGKKLTVEGVAVTIGYSTSEVYKLQNNIFRAFGVNRWEKVVEIINNENDPANTTQEITHPIKPEQPIRKFRWSGVFLIIGIVAVLFSGWVIGSRFPWAAVQIPTPTPTSTATSTATSTPHFEDTVAVMVKATIIAMQPRPTETFPPLLTPQEPSTGAGDDLTPTITSRPIVNPKPANINAGALNPPLWPYVVIFFTGVVILGVSISGLKRK